MSVAGYQYTIADELAKRVKESKIILDLIHELELKNKKIEENHENLDAAFANISTVFPNLVARAAVAGFPLDN